MSDPRVLSIAQFAEAAGISKQAVYKQLGKENSKIAPYVLKVNGKTVIAISALKDLYEVDINNSTFSTESQDNSTDKVEYSSDSSTKTVESSVEGLTDSSEVDSKKVDKNNWTTPNVQPYADEYIRFLRNELAELKETYLKTEQRLNDVIEAKDAVIREQAERIADLADQITHIAAKALETTSQQQYLTAAEKVGKQEPEDVVEQVESKPVEPVEQPQRKGFWARLWGK